MQIVIAQIPAFYEILDHKEMHKRNDEYREVVSPYSVFNENRLESSYPRVPSSSIPGSFLLRYKGRIHECWGSFV